MVPIRLGPTPSSGRVAYALAWARSKGIRIVSLSLNCVATSTLRAEIEACCEAGPGKPDMVICAASGNAFDAAGPERVGFPARHPEVIGVGASDKEDLRNVTVGDRDFGTWQSRYGKGLDVVAPGVEIWSTAQRSPPGSAGPDTWAITAGTSAATPQVAGLAALLLREKPYLSKARVRHIIERTCEKAGYMYEPHPYRERTPDTPTWNLEVGCGRVDAGKAFREVDEIAREEPPGTVAPYEPDPCNLDHAVVLAGYVGKGPRPGLWRLYEGPNLDRWVEFEEDAVIRHEPIDGGAKGRRFWLRRGELIAPGEPPRPGEPIRLVLSRPFVRRRY